MAETTIPVDKDVKAILEDHKQDGESWNATLLRLAGEGNGSVWTEDEIRSMARAEAKDMIQQYGGR